MFSSKLKPAWRQSFRLMCMSSWTRSCFRIKPKSWEPYKTNETRPALKRNNTQQGENPRSERESDTEPSISLSRQSIGMGLVVSATASCSDGIFGRRSPPSITALAADNNSTRPAPTAEVPDPELVRMFNHLDADGDGRISAAEMRKVNRCTDEAAEEMVAAADKDRDGFISLDEFLAVMGDGDDESDARATFDEFDANKDGVITAEELRLVLRRLGLGGEELTVQQCEEMMAAYDCNKDGVLSFDEFKAMMAAEPVA